MNQMPNLMLSMKTLMLCLIFGMSRFVFNQNTNPIFQNHNLLLFFRKVSYLSVKTRILFFLFLITSIYMYLIKTQILCFLIVISFNFQFWLKTLIFVIILKWFVFFNQETKAFIFLLEYLLFLNLNTNLMFCYGSVTFI